MSDKNCLTNKTVILSTIETKQSKKRQTRKDRTIRNNLKKEYTFELKLNCISLLNIELKLTDSLSLNLTNYHRYQKLCSCNNT